MNLLQRAIAIRDYKKCGLDFIDNALKQFDGHNGLVYQDHKLYQKGSLIAEAKVVREGLYSLNIRCGGFYRSLVTDSQEALIQHLVEWMANHV